MGKGQSRTYPKDLDQLERLKHENKRLKRQISSLRKQMSRIDVDRYQNLQELVDQQYKEDQEANKPNTRAELLKKWECFTCKIGHLKIIILNRLDGIFYFRRCTNCSHKTKLKKYTENVEGLKD